MENNEVDKHEDLRNALEEITHKALAMESVNLDKLYTALSKAQAEMEVAKKDSTNPFFKSSYSDLTSIVSASRPSLTKNGLAIIQRVKTNNDNKMYLLTRLCHSSGQWIESNMIINPPKSDIQAIGSYITYLRRYNWASIVGVVSDDDDDGNKAVENHNNTKNPKYLTLKQINEIENILSKLDGIEKINLLKWSQVESIQLIQQSKFEAIKNALTSKLPKGE